MLRLQLQKKDGKIEFDRSQFNYYIDKLGDGRYTMEIKKYYKKRTGCQNRYYWAIIEIIGNELGYDPQEMHETFKATYLGEIDDNGLIHSKSTTKQTTASMKEYMEKIIRFAAKNGIVIPDPE